MSSASQSYLQTAAVSVPTFYCYLLRFSLFTLDVSQEGDNSLTLPVHFQQPLTVYTMYTLTARHRVTYKHCDAAAFPK